VKMNRRHTKTSGFRFHFILLLFLCVLQTGALWAARPIDAIFIPVKDKPSTLETPFYDGYMKVKISNLFGLDVKYSRSVKVSNLILEWDSGAITQPVNLEFSCFDSLGTETLMKAAIPANSTIFTIEINREALNLKMRDNVSSGAAGYSRIKNGLKAVKVSATLIEPEVPAGMLPASAVSPAAVSAPGNIDRNFRISLQRPLKQACAVLLDREVTVTCQEKYDERKYIFSEKVLISKIIMFFPGILTRSPYGGLMSSNGCNVIVSCSNDSGNLKEKETFSVDGKTSLTVSLEQVTDCIVLRDKPEFDKDGKRFPPQGLKCLSEGRIVFQGSVKPLELNSTAVTSGKVKNALNLSKQESDAFIERVKKKAILTKDDSFFEIRCESYPRNRKFYEGRIYRMAKDLDCGYYYCKDLVVTFVNGRESPIFPGSVDIEKGLASVSDELKNSGWDKLGNISGPELAGWWWQFGTEFKIVGTDKFLDYECYVITGKGLKDAGVEVWVEKESGKLRKLIRQVVTKGAFQTGLQATEYYNYFSGKNGFEFPGLVQYNSGLKIWCWPEKKASLADIGFSGRESDSPVKTRAINRKNELYQKEEQEREERADDNARDTRYNTRSLSLSRYVDPLTGIWFFIPEGFKNKGNYSNCFEYTGETKQNGAKTGGTKVSDSGAASKKGVKDHLIITKFYSTKDFEALAAQIKQENEKKNPETTIKYSEKRQIKEHEAIILDIAGPDDYGISSKTKELFVRKGNAVIDIELVYYKMSDETAGKIIDKIIEKLQFGESSIIAHSFGSARLGELAELMGDNKDKEALEMINSELKKNPRDGELLYNEGVLLGKQGDKAEASRLIKAAFENGYCDFSGLFETKEGKRMVDDAVAQEVMKDRAKYYGQGRKVLLEKIKKELASYYEVKMKESNIIMYTDIRDNGILDIINEALKTTGELARNNIKAANTPYPVIWVLSNKNEVNEAMIGSLTGSSGYFSGLFVPAYGMLFTDADSGFGTVVHEYMHAIHRADSAESFEKHPRWLSEMLSTSVEELEWNEAKQKPEIKYFSGRYPGLLDAIIYDDVLPIEKLVSMTDKDLMSDKNIDVFYATVRYLGLYLSANNLTAKFYEEYKKDYREDATGRLALEKVLNTNLKDFQSVWENWAVTTPLIKLTKK